MSKLSNILTMLNILLSNQKIKIHELSEIIGVKERMIRLYKDDLVKAGFNIMSQPGKDGGYILDSDEGNTFQRFSRKEIDAIRDIAESYLIISPNFDVENELETILTKIKGYTYCKDKNDVKTTTFFDYAQPNIDFEGEKDKLTKIKDAIKKQKKMEIEYMSLKFGLIKREIHPISLIYRKGFWYTRAYCELRKETRLFKNCRIVTYVQLTECFEKQTTMKNETGKHFGITGSKEYQITLKIYFPMSIYIKERIWARDQTIEYNSSDNSIIFSGTMSGLPEIRRWILGMGSKVEIQSPELLKKNIHEELINSLKYFEP